MPPPDPLAHSSSPSPPVLTPFSSSASSQSQSPSWQPSSRPQPSATTAPLATAGDSRNESPISNHNHRQAPLDTSFGTAREDETLFWEAPELAPAASNSVSASPIAQQQPVRRESRAGPSNPAASILADRRGSHSEVLEMEPITGHRRRRSSLMNPLGSQPTTTPTTRSRGHGRAPSATALSEDAASLLEEEDKMGSSDDENDGDSDEDLHDDEETGLTGQDRHRKQKKRRRNTQLDQRIAPEKDITPEERKEADRGIIRRMAINGFLILLWYLFSLSISIYNKWMFDPKRLNFHFPLFTTSIHMLVQFGLSSLVLWLIPSLRPSHARMRHGSESEAPAMTPWFYFTRIGPCGAATGLDIGLGNTSLKFISLTFYTMCKSSSLAFVLLFAFIFRLETPTWKLVAIIATMTGGVILMVFGEVEFKLGGFFLVISAAFLSGLRWALTQILLLRNPATSNPFSSIFYLTPVMFVVLFIIALPVEGPGNLVEGFASLADAWGLLVAPLILIFPGCLAFCMTASEFALLKRTSVVTLSIAGIFKEVVTISAASLVFHDELTVINFVGLLITMAAIFAYNYIKINKMRKKAQVNVHNHHLVDEDADSSSNSDAEVERDDEDEEGAGLLHDGGDHAAPHHASEGNYQPLLEPLDSPQGQRQRTD